MQLSAANLLIASQQLARGGAAKPDANAQAQFAQALAKENGVETAEFAPMEFRQAAPAKAAAASPPTAPTTGYSPGQRLGANLDIRV